MRVSRGLAILVVPAAIVGLALTPSTASSAPDRTPPTLVSPVKAAFIVGTVIEPGGIMDCVDDPHDLRLSVPVTFTWQGTDAVSAVKYSLTQFRGFDGDRELFANSTLTSYTGTAMNWDQTCGGGSPSVYEWQLTATDAAGNSTTNKVYGGRIGITQDTNLTDQAVYAQHVRITYQGAWGTSKCTCWSDGGVHRTTARNASATIKDIAPPPDPEAILNHRVALVMEKGPNRGKFQVLVDGKLKTTVDLYAPATQTRTIVWQAAFANYGHTIKVVNLATSGRPRIDIDAVLTN